MRPPPCLCSLSVRMEVKCGTCGVMDAEVSFDSCIVMMSGCAVCMRCLSSSTVLLIYICLFHTHMVYCYIMTNIIMNTHNNNNNKRYNKILKSADSISR